MFRDLRLFTTSFSILNRYTVASSSLRYFANQSVFVKGLDASATESGLRQHMEQSGEVVSCYVPQEFGQSRGFGIVKYGSDEEANKAISELNQSAFLGKVIYVSEQRKAPTDPLKIFVRNIPEGDWEEVKQHFEQFGEISSCKVFNKEDGPFSALIEFVSEDSTKQALAEKTTTFRGAQVEINEFKIKKERTIPSLKNYDENLSPFSMPDNTKAFVTGLSTSVNYVDIKDHFDSAGRVKFVRIIMDKFTGESKGSAIVQFGDSESAERAISKLNKTTIGDSYITVRPFETRAR